MKPTEQYSFSFDNERYWAICDSFEEALEDARLEAKYSDPEPKTVYIGKVYEFEPRIDVDSVIERLQDDACDQAGECAEDYLEHVRIADRLELERMLTHTFLKWATKTGNEPTFFVAEEVGEYNLEDCDHEH